jgi:hypothetical protein
MSCRAKSFKRLFGTTEARENGHTGIALRGSSEYCNEITKGGQFFDPVTDN